jgi:predicted nicotinamide N-methyase
MLTRIRNRFETIDEQFQFGPIRINFTRVKEPDVVLDQIVDQQDRLERASGKRLEGDALHLPYWAELWDSSIGLGLFLAEKLIHSQRSTLHSAAGISVLDLGCGMGLAGTVAAAMGHRVLLADLESDALLFAKLNTLPYQRRSRTRKLNWQTDRLNERFDLIVGADVLYEKAQWEFLNSFWRAHLAENGSILLGEPGRQSGDQFIDWIGGRGWTLTQFEQRIPARQSPIRLIKLSR